MPHLPRRYPSTIGVPTELLQPPQEAHNPIPVKQPDKPETKRHSLSMSKINPHTYEPDKKQVLRILFGKEPEIDNATGQLVFPNKPRT